MTTCPLGSDARLVPRAHSPDHASATSFATGAARFQGGAPDRLSRSTARRYAAHVCQACQFLIRHDLAFLGRPTDCRWGHWFSVLTTRLSERRANARDSTTSKHASPMDKANRRRPSSAGDTSACRESAPPAARWPTNCVGDRDAASTTTTRQRARRAATSAHQTAHLFA